MELLDKLLDRSDDDSKPEEDSVSLFYDDTSLDYADTENLVSGSVVPVRNARRALERYVNQGEVSVEDFAYAVENASEVWEEYLEKEEHNPRRLSERDVDAFMAGAAGPGFSTNAPAYSSEVENQVDEYRSEVQEELEDSYGRFTAWSLAESLIEPEEVAEASLRAEYGIEDPEEGL